MIDSSNTTACRWARGFTKRRSVEQSVRATPPRVFCQHQVRAREPNMLAISLIFPKPITDSIPAASCSLSSASLQGFDDGILVSVLPWAEKMEPLCGSWSLDVSRSNRPAFSIPLIEYGDGSVCKDSETGVTTLLKRTNCVFSPWPRWPVVTSFGAVGDDIDDEDEDDEEVRWTRLSASFSFPEKEATGD